MADQKYLGKPIKLVEVYKGKQIWDWNGTICVNDPEDGMEHQYIVCMDDSKRTGKREFDESQNNVEGARKYIDLVTKDERPETLKLKTLAAEFNHLKEKLFGEHKFVVVEDNDDSKRYNQLFQFFFPSFRTKDFVNPLN